MTRLDFCVQTLSEETYAKDGKELKFCPHPQQSAVIRRGFESVGRQTPRKQAIPDVY